MKIKYGVIELELLSEASYRWNPDCSAHPVDREIGWYEAKAVDNHGSKFIVRWEIIDPSAEDECNKCDWDDPSIIIPIN